MLPCYVLGAVPYGMKKKLSPYLPGILLFLLALILGLSTYKDYGMSWDEPSQRDPAVLEWNYAVHGNQELFKTSTDNHGAGFELLLLAVEKSLHLTDTRDIYLSRHIFTHIFFLLSAFAGYVLVYRLFKDKWIAGIGFIMFVFAPRIYAHSFFNSKDLPFLSMVLVTLAVSQLAFDKKKMGWFALLGIVVGYATGISIMVIMYAFLITGILCIELALSKQKEESPRITVINLALFLLGFCVALYLSWPYLWKEPVTKFIESFQVMSHYNKFTGAVLFQGQYIDSDKLPWTYFPVWFGITMPVVWLVAGLAGFIWVLFDFFKKPTAHLENSSRRNFIFYAIGFAGPIVIVLVQHSVIYDDWRHIYFVYPPFVLLALYAIQKLYKTKWKLAMLGILAVQVAFLTYFFVVNHPYEQVYFNALATSDDEELRHNYELEYWGCSFKQALDHLLVSDKSPVIKVCANYDFPLNNNIMMLKKEDRSRFLIVDSVPLTDYYLTNFRMHPGDYPSNDIEYEIKVRNSTIMRVYRFPHQQPKLQ